MEERRATGEKGLGGSAYGIQGLVFVRARHQRRQDFCIRGSESAGGPRGRLVEIRPKIRRQEVGHAVVTATCGTSAERRTVSF